VLSTHGAEGLNCLFAGLPITCVWLSLSQASNRPHIDADSGPATFVMTSTSCAGGDLVVTSPVDGSQRNIRLRPGQLLGGAWALYRHWNLTVHGEPGDIDGQGETHSWVFYLNRNILNIGEWEVVLK